MRRPDERQGEALASTEDEQDAEGVGGQREGGRSDVERQGHDGQAAAGEWKLASCAARAAAAARLRVSRAGSASAKSASLA